MKRRAPEGGYVFAEKERYRFNVWSRLAQHCPVPRHAAQVLLMPSAEGIEIEVALSRGFREENLHLVDRSAAIISRYAHSYPKSQRYGVEIERACERIAARGISIHVANLDFTSCMGFQFADVLRAISTSGAMHRSASWAMTLLRGREACRPQAWLLESGKETLPSGALRKHMDSGQRQVYRELHQLMERRRIGEIPLQPSDALRVGFMIGLTGTLSERQAQLRLPTLDMIGAYLSGRQTMLWAVFRACKTGRAALVDHQIACYAALVNVDMRIWELLLEAEELDDLAPEHPSLRAETEAGVQRTIQDASGASPTR